MGKLALGILKWLSIFGSIGVSVSSPVVSSVSPSKIGLGGGVVTIEGAGFSEDVFNQFDPVLGNKVWFANEFVSVPCQNPINWNFLLENPQDPSTTRIVCDLPPREGSKGSDWFSLILKVDGEEVPNSFSVRYYWRYTPKIKKVVPKYGKPGGMITLDGTFFTKEYGNVNFQDGNDTDPDSRREASITAVMLGSRECELTDELGNMYGTSLDSADSNEGTITCKPGGTFIGPINATVFISEKYGKSQIGGAYSINSKGQMFVYHTLPEVTSVSPNTGGSAGGTYVTITGNTFDSMVGKTQVMIGDTPCEIISVKNEEVVCSTPAEEDLTGTNAGARGLLYEIWTETEDSTISDTSAADYNSVVVDGSTVDGPLFNETNGYTARLSGLFVAPYTGKMSFYLLASDAATLYLSNNTDPANKVKIVEHTSSVMSAEKGDPHTAAPIELVKGELYYIEAVHVQASGSSESNFLQISLWEHETIYHASQTSAAYDEQQILDIWYEREFETQQITFNDMPDAAMVTFTHAGIKAKSDISMSNKADWTDIWQNMMTYSCEYSHTNNYHKQDYENPSYNLPGAGGSMVEDVQAHCGARAMQNQGRITHTYGNGGINIRRYPWLCFAAFGETYNGQVQLLLLWEDNNGRDRRDWAYIKTWEPSNSWSYQCLDMEDAVSNPNNTWIANHLADNSYMQIQDIILRTGQWKGNYYMDDVTVSKEPVDIVRTGPSLPNDNLMVNYVTATEVTNSTAFDVQVVPWTCNPEEDDLELFGVFNTSIAEVDTTGMDALEAYNAKAEYLKTADFATFTNAEWGSGSITVNRTVRGTRRMTGLISLSYNGKTIEIDPYIKPMDMVSALESFGMIGVKAENDGTYNKCYHKWMRIKFSSSWGGDIDQIGFNSSNLVLDNGGKDYRFRWLTSRNGGVMVEGPGGDFFRLQASQPTISVSVNGFLASCAADDCSFTHDAALTPSLNSVASSGDELTINGSGFTEDITDYVVMVGSLSCEVTAATASSITCTLEAGSAGVYDVSVVVKSLGLASQPEPQLTHEVTMSIFSSSPTEGSMGGGTTITVTGTGFPASVEGWAGGSVSIAGSECKVIASTYGEFQCITSANNGGGRRKRAASEISITVGTASATGGSFNYDASLTPSVTAVSPCSSSPLGGEVLSISGTAFGYNWGQVLLGDAECKILTWFDESITCTLPANSHGDYPVHVSVPNQGYADVSTVCTINYNFVVTNIWPRKGSRMGGTKVNVTGSGFGDCSDVTVKFGENYNCVIDSCSDSEIICDTEKIPQIHQVSNGGRHPQYGPGYVWSPQEVEIQPGDIVDWIWNLQVASDDTGISVQQTASPTTNDWDGQGFKSDRSANGRLQTTFDAPGTYYYSSQAVFGDSLFMKGVVTVVNSAEDSTYLLSVMMGDIPAAQEIGPDTGNVNNGDCGVIDSDCIADPSSIDEYLFTFASCLTPSVSQIIVDPAENITANPIEGFNNAELTIVGSGFSDDLCQNVVTIGENGGCTVTSATSSEIICTVDGSGEPPLESLNPKKINVKVINSGNAVLEVADPSTTKFNLVPQISSVNIVSGSWAGGSLYILSGSGLVPYGGQESVFVTFGTMGCSIVDVKFDYISCLVPDYSAYKGALTSKEVEVSVNIGYDQFSPIVTNGNLTFTFDDALTASATSMTPVSVGSETSVTVSGSNFGTSAKVYLRNKNVARLRRRRSVPEEPKLELPNNEMTSEDLWVKMTGVNPKNWKCLHGQSCNVADISASRTPSARYRREADPLFPKYAEWAEESLENLMNEVCIDDEAKCVHMIKKRSVTSESLSRDKRAANEESLLEMALLTDGTYEATVTEVTDSNVTFTTPALPAGEYDVIVSSDGQGNALSSLSSLTSVLNITSVDPNEGSIYGGQIISIHGSGFCPDPTVTIGGSTCAVISSTADTISCITSECADGAQDVVVSSCGQSVTLAGGYTCSLLATPDIAITPISGSGPTTLTIDGTNLGSDPTVRAGNYACQVTASSATQVTCDLPDLPGGTYDVILNNPALGDSNPVEFTSILEISSVNPSSGSFGGGTPLVITGTGFDADNVAVTICNNPCLLSSVTTSEINCITPPNDSDEATLACDVFVSQTSGNVTEANGFTYDSSLTPSVAAISPVRGGTGGGTKITITGAGFADSGNVVSIDGSPCVVVAESSTEIECLTEHHSGAIEAPVVVDVPDQGYAAYDDVDAATFYYIDRWSSIWTWGGLGTPLEGEFIVITEGQTILLDTSTPVLAFLLIQGGKLMFDGEQAEIELQSKYILLVDGGQLEIGTEEESYPSKAIITMHGHTRCVEMPVFGCKVIGVRNGTLDFHGQYVPVTWTHLAETADAGSTEIVLKQPVTWQVGDHIAIATTSDRSSMKENEEHYVAGVSADGLTITLQDPLKYRHISIEQTFGTHVVESRGEVGLLTRNILIRGNYNEEFLETIPACETEFNSGASMSDSMQSCFAGKFGEELGSDEMGAIIIISPKYKDQGLVQARIEYTEFLNAGQAFRVGRYPIHFHLPGNMSTSYVRGNAIHHSNNRACTLHDVSNMVVERNVVFNVKGLSFFLEDGVEEYNTLQYNLAIFTRMSNSLLNPDINPASFWIVNANNKFRHNACAGGTHFCFWMRPAKIPDGPSWTRNYCPNKVPFDEFHNNTAHSMGWYGFWIMGQSNHAGYDPHDGDISSGYCKGNRIQARIGSFTTWNNKRGFEIVAGKNIRLENQTHMDHDFAGFDIFAGGAGGGPLGPDGPGIVNSVIVGHSMISDLTEGKADSCIPNGVALTPDGYTLENVEFYNFDRDGCKGLFVKLEDPKTTGSKVRTSGLIFDNSPNKVFNPEGEDHGMNIFDADGTLTGVEGGTLVGHSDTNPPTCVEDTTGDLGEAHQGGHPGAVCPPGEVFHRVKVIPNTSSIKYNTLTVSNDFGNSTRKWAKMLDGWDMLLPQGEGNVNWINFDNNEHVTNISYSMSVEGMNADSGNFILLGHQLTQEPDRFTLLPGQNVNASAAMTEIPTYDDSVNGDWYLANSTTHENGTEMVFIVSDKSAARKKRSVPGEIGTWPANDKRGIDFKVYRCLYDGCLPPPPPTVPAGRPLDFHKWSNASAWEELDIPMPTAGATVFIPPGVWMVLDMDPPPLRMIIVEEMAALEVEDGADRQLDVEILLLRGGKLQVGTQDTPFQSKFDLILSGDHYTEDQPLPNGPNLGAKALGVFGYADMHGVDVGTSWTKLAATAAAGDTTIELSEAVTWADGSEIVISTTSYELHETEKRTIASVSGTTVTLTEALEFEHLGTDATLSNGDTFSMKAEVGLLSRNIRIVGKAYADQEEEKFGARVLVGWFEQEGTEYVGFARFSNVEWAVAGQDGWYDNFDPRYSLAYLDTGDSVDSNGAPNAPESYVKKCAFNFNYNTAIGLFGSNNIAVEDNVIFRHINDGILDESDGARINGNLVTKGESIPRILGLTANPDFYGCINNKRSVGGSLIGNVAAGCAQAGILSIGNECDQPNKMYGNEAHGAQQGGTFHSKGVMRLESGCGRFNDFLTWKNWDYGVALQTENSMEFDNIRALDNGVGFLPWVAGPSSYAHLWENKYVTLQNSVIVGVSDVYNCDVELVKPDIFNSGADNQRKWKGRGKSQGGWKAHHHGIIWPIFQASFSDEWHPWFQALKGATGADVGLRGIMHLNNVTFANFGDNCGQRDVVLRTNFGSDDINWPINVTDVKFVDVANDNKIYVDEPLLGKINPSDCTDMDCDGFKKLIVYDDGSFSDGNPGTIIPDSAFEWDGNPMRGLGYYRVPKPMITTVDGQKIEYADKMPNTGIYRGENGDCVWNDAWRAYKCQNINHRLMIIESMDRDTKIRRLGPIAVLANPGANGYVDLVNGPQDFSCCSGYICAERLSTFFTMLATGQMYEIMFTSVSPQNFRLHMLHNAGGEGTLLKIWFQKQQRYDIYVNGKLIMPNNIDTTSEDYNLHPPSDAYIPALDEAHGSNYFDPNTGHLYILIKDGIVDIKTQPIVILKMGLTVPIENFFEENVVANLAGLLGIDPSNIRVTNIVRENSVGRKKRDTSDDGPVTGLEFEIGPPPLEDLVEFMPEEYTYVPETSVTPNPAYTTQSTARPTTEAFVEPEGYLNYDMLQNVQAQVTNAFQTGGIELEGIAVGELSMEEPLVPPEAPPPYEGADARAEVTELTFAEQQALANEELLNTYEERTVPVPTSIHLTESSPEDVQEMLVMNAIQIYVKDDAGKLVTVLGDESDPWEVTVSVINGPGNVLGNITVPFIGGLATFDGIFVDTMGSDYKFEFTLTYPTTTTILPVESNMFSVAGRPLGLRFNDFNILQPQNQSFSINASIWDEALDQEADWYVLLEGVGNYWECTATLNNGNFSGTTEVSLVPGEGLVAFDDLIIEEMSLNNIMTIECFGNNTSTTVMATSQLFHIYDAPTTGLLTQINTDFTYNGKISIIQPILDAFSSSMGTIECTGCPAGSISGDKKSVATQSFNECWSPLKNCTSGN